MIKKKNVPTIIGVFILLVGAFVGVFFLQKIQVFKIGANTPVVPKDIRTSNVTDTSATISWITPGASSDFISWGETQGNLNKVENESDTNQKFFTHSITIAGLKADTTYYYKINSDGTDYNNSGIPWQFATGAALSGNQSSIPVSGSVISASGEPSKRAIVYIDVNSYLLSTLTSDSGNFILQLGQTRTPDFKSFAQIDSAGTLLQISIKSESGETSSAQIYPQSANPIPPIILGQVQDYRSLQPSDKGTAPNANLNLPGDTTQGSKFDVSTPSATTKPTTIILEGIDNGEVVTSDQPQFFGKGPAGSTVTVTIHSDQQIKGTVKIPKSGSWSYTPPTPLSPGAHSIILSWIDASGITRTLTRDFVVQAGEVPAFTASGSGSTPTASPKPTITPTNSPTPKPIVTPKPTLIPSPTPEPVPVTGDLTPTLLLFMMGVVVVFFGIFVWKISENQ